MKFAKTTGTLGLMALAAIASPYALADDAGWYVGTNVGQSRATIDDPRISSGLRAGGFKTSAITDDDRSAGFKVFGGKQNNKNNTQEGKNNNLGKFGYTATTVPAGTL